MTTIAPPFTAHAMRGSRLLAALAALCLAVLGADLAGAQVSNGQSFVSIAGNDASGCFIDQPCRTFSGALANTKVNGQISCLGSGDFGPLFIQKSITVDCHDLLATTAGFVDIGGETINILIALPATDPLRTVRLRNLIINGTLLQGPAVAQIGIKIESALHVFIDDVRIDAFTRFGIFDRRNGSGNLYIRNAIVRDIGGTGLVVLPLAGSVDAVVDSSHFNRNNFGLSAGNRSRVVVNGSTFMGNAVQGVHADAGGRLNIDRSVINGNTTGVGADAGSTVRLANTDIMFNGTGISGNTFSFTNNRLIDNGIAGTAPTPIGAATSDTGQQ
jgi:hypothetical protein